MVFGHLQLEYGLNGQKEDRYVQNYIHQGNPQDKFVEIVASARRLRMPKLCDRSTRIQGNDCKDEPPKPTQDSYCKAYLSKALHNRKDAVIEAKNAELACRDS